MHCAWALARLPDRTLCRNSLAAGRSRLSVRAATESAINIIGAASLNSRNFVFRPSQVHPSKFVL